jgi:hypothetical protein
VWDEAIENSYAGEEGEVAPVQPEEKRFSLGTDENGKKFVIIVDDILDGVDEKNIVKTVRNYIKESFENGYDVAGLTVKNNSVGRKEFTSSKYSNKIKARYQDIFIDKMRTARNLDEIISNADNYQYEMPDHERKDDIIGFVRGKINIRVGKEDYKADVILADSINKKMFFYDIIDLEKTQIKEAIREPADVKKTVPETRIASNNSIAENEKNTTNFSLSVDSAGRSLTEEQKKFFADESPLLLTEDGALKRYYHGTARVDRVGTVFDPERATSGPMAFFTDNQEIANNYARDKKDTSLAYDTRYDTYFTRRASQGARELK